ncbi:SafA/ExsA family spore coat assembly protein, partial [Bacillaceae bacterium SIJ1]|uniref:SafA/ExsA family spore coat assembly protein n=1 Tax=Litoribacterium kuwaitense TaxID=1398745 RepID=UPI0013EB441F
MKIHIVQKGDTLWNLSQKYQVPFAQLKQANTQLSDPDQLMPGMKIKIPSGSVQVKKKPKETPVMPAKPKEVPKKEKPKEAPIAHKPYKDKTPKAVQPYHYDESISLDMPFMHQSMYNVYLPPAPQPPAAKKEEPKPPKKEKPVKSESVEESTPYMPPPPPMMPYPKGPCVPCSPVLPGSGLPCPPGQQPWGHHGPPPMPSPYPVAGAQMDESCGCGPQPGPWQGYGPMQFDEQDESTPQMGMPGYGATMPAMDGMSHMPQQQMMPGQMGNPYGQYGQMMPGQMGDPHGQYGQMMPGQMGDPHGQYGQMMP